MAGAGAKEVLRNVTALEQLIEEINFQRAKEMRQCLMSKDSDSGFAIVRGNTYWTDLFVRHFLFQTDRSTDADDLLFFIRKRHVRGHKHIPKYNTEVEVYRKDSRKLPIGDPDIDWEETVYLNLIIHQFDYTLTLAVCTRTSPKDLQVLRRHSQKVYASPSRRRMDTKGEVEEITYPNVCFHVDNFDEVFCDMHVRDGEMVCVELVATDHAGERQAVIFLGSIRYDALKKVYDARGSLTSKVAQRMMLGLFSGSNNQRIEFVRMKGPLGKGHAEMAVAKPKGSGVETPTSEPGMSLTDLWDCDWEDEPEDRLLYRHQRRLSDPSANFNNFMQCGWRARGMVAGNDTGGRARSENEGLDSFADGLYEIESGDVRDGSSRCCRCCAFNALPLDSPYDICDQSVKCGKCSHLHPVKLASNVYLGEQTVEPTTERAGRQFVTGVHDDPKIDVEPLGGIVVQPRSISVEPSSTELSKTEKDVRKYYPGKNSVLPNDVFGDDILSEFVVVHNNECENYIDDGGGTEAVELDPFLPHEILHQFSRDSDLGVISKNCFPDRRFSLQEELPTVSFCRASHTIPKANSSLFTRKPGSAVRVKTTFDSVEHSQQPPLSFATDRKYFIRGKKILHYKFPSKIKIGDDDDKTFKSVSENVNMKGDKEDVDQEDVLHPLLIKEDKIEAVKVQQHKITLPYKKLPDETTYYFVCDIKLDDGAYNPLWSTRGFAQTFHFWKENRRAQSVPLNAYLTYVTLPWFNIITDILDHSTGPILTF